MALNNAEIAIFTKSDVVREAMAAAGNDKQKVRELGQLFSQLCEHNRIFFSYQAEKSFKKYSDGILYGIKIFVSYKIGFGKAASLIIEPFRIYGNRRICIDDQFPYMCELAADVGKNYSKEIADALDRTHWFFLLLPDHSLDRSWTLFEAGYFKRAMDIEDRLIGIHHSEVEMAGPLKDLKNVQAEIRTVGVFLKDLLQKPNPIPGMEPINPEVSPDRFHSHSKAISKAIQPSRKISRQYRINYIDIALQSGQAPKDVEELLASIVMEGQGFDKIFGYDGPSSDICLHEILKSAGPSQQFLTQEADDTTILEKLSSLYWLQAIVVAIQMAVGHKTSEPSDAILLGKDKKYYRPTLLSVRRYADNNAPASAHIAFHESVTGPIHNCPRELSALGTTLRMGYRFKWEVLEQFKFGLSEDDADCVRSNIERMERESHQRSYYHPDRTIDEFQDSSPVFAAFSPEIRPRIRKLAEDWYKLRNPKKTGRLDQAFEQRNTKEVEDCLRQLKQLNQEFMILGTKRYSELVEEYWKS